VFDFTYHQIDALRDLMQTYEADNVIGQHVGDKGTMDVDLFTDGDERLLHAVISPLGHVRTSPVIGLGSVHDHSEHGNEAA
jgi:hypothetical protein